MINRFREWILKVVNAYDTDYIPGKISKEKGFTQKNLGEIKKTSKETVVSEVKKSTKKRNPGKIPSEYEIENVFMELNDEIPRAKKYNRTNILTKEERLLYHFRFLNYSNEDYDRLRHSLKNNLSLPEEFQRFDEYLYLKKGRLYFKELPILSNTEIQTICRNCYFDPTKPFAVDQIYREISHKAANLSRAKVRLAVQRIEEYQLRRRLVKPKSVEANFVTTSSNTCLCDMFFINEKGKKYKFFNICEAFSGYIKTYYVSKGTKSLIKSCMIDFLKEIKQYNHEISRILCDNGGENQSLHEIPGITVHFMKAGQPAHLIEYYNSLVAKAIMLYIDINFDPSQILELVLTGLNSRKRKRRNQFTPIEILQMTKAQQKRIAQDVIYRVPEEHYNLKKIYPKSFVRILELSRKDQRVRKLDYKGYRRKYSKEIFQVQSRRLVKGTLRVYKYKINGREYFRNELLLVPEICDKTIPDIQHKNFSYPKEDDSDSSGIYIPSDEEGD